MTTKWGKPGMKWGNKYPILLVALLFCSPALAGGWAWDPCEGATGYRLYWDVVQVDAPNSWTWRDCVRVETTETSVIEVTPDPGPGEMTVIIVTAFNDAGESGTGWGEGTTHGPIEPCTSPAWQ